MFAQSQHIQAVFRGGQDYTQDRQSNLVMYKSILYDAAFEGMKGSCREVEAGTTKGAREMLLVKAQPSCSRRFQHVRDASTMGQPPRTTSKGRLS